MTLSIHSRRGIFGGVWEKPEPCVSEREGAWGSIVTGYAKNTIRRLPGASVFCVCALLLLCLSGSWPAKAAQPERTLPVKASATEQRKGGRAKIAPPPAVAPSAAPKRTEVDALAPSSSKLKKAATGAAPGPKAKAGPGASARKRSKGFSGNPLLPDRRARADDRKKPKVVYGPAGQRREKYMTLGDEGRVTMSAKRKTVPESRLAPARTAFSGSEHTLPYMDSETPPEVSMQYKVKDDTATRLTINPQDASSPLYRPAESDGTVNSAGIYVDMDVRPDMQLQVGGEYCDIESRNASAGSSQGASLGLKWNF